MCDDFGGSSHLPAKSKIRVTAPVAVNRDDHQVLGNILKHILWCWKGIGAFS